MPWSQVLLDLRQHARHEGLRAALFLAGGTAIVVPLIALTGCVALIYNVAKKIPPKALFIAAAGLGVALLIPQSRKFLIDAGKTALQSLKKAGAAIAPIVAQGADASMKAQATAQAMRPALERKLARALVTRLTLTQAVYRTCLLAGKPLSVEEIWTTARRDGARFAAKEPLRSVLRALKRHPLLEMVPGGRWQVVKMKASV